MTNTSVELHHDDFDEWGRELVWMAGEHLISQARNVLHHDSDGEGWAPWPEDDTAAVARQARDLIERMDQAVREARRHLAEAERPARLRALRRIRTANERERDQ